MDLAALALSMSRPPAPEGTMDAETTAAYERLKDEMDRLDSELRYGP